MRNATKPIIISQPKYLSSIKEPISSDPKIIAINNERQATFRLNKLAIPEHSAITFIDHKDILYCEADSNYTHIHVSSGKKITSSKCLKDIEGSIDSFEFFRVHAKYLINLNHINKLHKSTQWFIDIDNTSLPVSRSKIDSLKSILHI